MRVLVIELHVYTHIHVHVCVHPAYVYNIVNVVHVSPTLLRRWVPVYADREKRLGIMSIGFLLQSRDDAVVWRGPKKNGKQRSAPHQ